MKIHGHDDISCIDEYIWGQLSMLLRCILVCIWGVFWFASDVYFGVLLAITFKLMKFTAIHFCSWCLCFIPYVKLRFFVKHSFTLHRLENRTKPVSTPHDDWCWCYSDLHTSACESPLYHSVKDVKVKHKKMDGVKVIVWFPLQAQYKPQRVHIFATLH